MFLFTNPAPAPSPATARQPGSAPVVDAIRQGAEATGADFDYLLRTARRESALDPSAKAPTSSATGLFQFIEQTWLGLVKSDGDRLGLAEQAKAVTTRQDGTLTVADPAARQALLDLRKDPQIASVMAGALTRQNRDALTAATGRSPSAGELYMAHVLGARGAVDLISAARGDPTRVAAGDFPEAARANRGIFYAPGGRPRGAGEVYAALASAQAGTGGADPNGAPAAAVSPPLTHEPGLRGLFQTGIRSGPLSEAVAKIWRTNNDGRSRAAAASFFPRSASAADDGSASDAAAGAEAAEGAAAQESAPPGAAAPIPSVRLDIPLPPVRPSFAPAERAGGERPTRAAYRPDRTVRNESRP